MWRRAFLLPLFVLAVALVLMKRRLREAEAELKRVRAERSATSTNVTRPVGGEPGTTSDPAAGTRGGEVAEVATGGPDLASEWEQAVPPMDS